MCICVRLFACVIMWMGGAGCITAWGCISNSQRSASTRAAQRAPQQAQHAGCDACHLGRRRHLAHSAQINAERQRAAHVTRGRGRGQLHIPIPRHAARFCLSRVCRGRCVCACVRVCRGGYCEGSYIDCSLVMRLVSAMVSW